MEPRNMEIAELRDKVAEASLKLHSKALSDNEAAEILSLVAMVLDEQIAADQRRLVTDEAASTARLTQAVRSLSYSEVKAMTAIFSALDGPTGLIVTSKVADEIGLARSVIVAALKKLEGAGVLTSQSLGMKGTFIKVLQLEFLDELKAVA